MNDSKAEKKKPGPDPERLVIEDDPQEALDKLLKKEEKNYSPRFRTPEKPV